MKFIFTAIAIVIAGMCYAQNPWLVKQINNYGNAFGAVGSAEFYNLNGKLVFFANDSTHGLELWQSDGTAAGTTLLKDITPGAQGSNIAYAYQAGNILYFVKYNSTELWRTDGTVAGTFKLTVGGANTTFLLYGGNENTSLFNVANIGSNLYVVAQDVVGNFTYNSIYKIDGITGVATLYLSTRGGIGAIGASNNKIYVNANYYYGADGTTDIGYEVYVYPAAGVIADNLNHDFTPGPASTVVSEFVNVNDKYMLFYGRAGSDWKLMRMKGDEILPVIIGDIPNNGTFTDFNTGNGAHAWNEDWSLGDKYIFKNGAVNGGGFYFTATDGEASGTFNIQAPNLSLMLGRTTDKIILGGALFSSKLVLWDGVSPTSFTYLPDAVSGASLSGNFVWRAVQLGNRIIYFTSDGGAKSVFQSGIDGSNCLPLMQFSTGYLGNIVIGNNYYGWGQGDGTFQYTKTNLQLVSIGAYKIFTGTVSNDWANKDNWMPAGVPGADDDVYIPKVTNNPVISANATCRSLYINTGTLTVNAGFNIDVLGNLTVAGTLTGSGTLTRKGTYANKTFGSGTTGISQLNINGADIEYNVETGVTGSLANMLTVGSVFNFQTDNKVILNNTSLQLTKAPFATGVSNKRFFETNKTGGVMYIINSSSPVTVSIPVSSASGQYSPAEFTGAFDNIGVRVVDSVNASGTTGKRLSANVVNKTWLINASAKTPSSVKLFWGQQSELPGFNRNNSFVVHYDGGKWVNGKKQAAVLSNNMYSVAQDGYTSFSPFTVGSGDDILPVVLTYFTGQLKNGQPVLNWATAAEINTAGFNIERSKDGTNFQKIGFIAAEGDAKQVQAYTYTDATAGTGNNFYRLKLIDIDGKFTYSKTVTINNAGTLIYCSITKNVLFVNGLTAGQNIQVYNNNGQLVARAKAAGSVLNVNLANSAAGVYYVKVITGAALPATTVKVVK